MISRLKTLLWLICMVFIIFDPAFSQNSGRQYRRSGILNGNQVKTVFGNWGVIGQPSNAGPRGAWIYDTNGYIGDVSPLVGAEVTGKIAATGKDTTFFWIIDCPAARPFSGDPENNRAGVRRAFEPVAGYFNETGNSPAISADKKTWPPFWPDIQDPSDPRYDPEGWAGSWNGFFGKDVFNADLETYFVMDDNNDNEFNTPQENDYGIEFHPIINDPSRQGMGLDVRVRGLQWQQILAQDNIFWLYNIKNNGDFIYPRAVFGMLVGTYVGVTGTDDSPQEYDDDYSFFDVNEDLTYTGAYPNDNSRNPFWVDGVGIVGYAFLESPGNPFDGIDNDNDADSPGLTPVSPLFTENDFVPETFTNNPNPPAGFRNKFVTISKQTVINPYGQEIVRYNRIVNTLTTPETTVVSLGDTFHIVSGVTRVVEGNTVIANGQQEINPNALDGKDNDLDGLIDENYFLHYRQVRRSSTGQILFDILNPLHHVNYFTGSGLNDQMLDERRDDGIDNDGDWSHNPLTGEEIRDDNGVLIDDVGQDGRPGTGDPGENNGRPDPGEPNFDQLDKSESDQIGLSSFWYFAPANQIRIADENFMWQSLRPGFFAVPPSIVNGKPTRGEDGDFMYGTGYFPLTPGQTERLSLALIYAYTEEELVKKLSTVRDIYNADYRFPIAPEKPDLKVVAGDNQVTLYWDRKAEKSFDPVLRTFDFEGYKIYRATDPNFIDARDVTNSVGNIVAYSPIAQFDLVDGIDKIFYAPYDLYQTLQGWGFNLGSETGLVHSYVDSDVKNGRTYYYAVVSYDQGDNEKGIIPNECTKKITQLSSGQVILDVNTAVVTPSPKKAGYTAPSPQDTLAHSTGGGYGTVSYKILDETVLNGHPYQVYFWDTSNDGIDNNNNWTLADDLGADGIANTGDKGEGDGKPTVGEPNLDYKDPKEMEAVTTHYAVLDKYEYTEDFVPRDTFYVDLLRQNLVSKSIMVREPFGNVVDTSLYTVDTTRGRIKATYSGALTEKQYTITYQYNPVYFSPYMQGSPWIENIKDTDIFDGITLNFDNVWETELDLVNSGWNDKSIQYGFVLKSEPIVIDPDTIIPVIYPANYEIRMSSEIVDTTAALYGVPPSPRKFSIYNTTGNYKVKYIHDDQNGDLYPSFPQGLIENIYIFEKDVNGDFTIYARVLYLTSTNNYTYQFKGGEVLSVIQKFPFNHEDIFSLNTTVPQIDNSQASQELADILVYPNPYIVAHAFEPPLPPNVTSGRGERRIYFSKIPQGAKIHIFTARGEHVITLEDKSSIFNGTLVWNLKTKENLDVAYGVYFYVMESPAGTKRGKIAIIK
jgi:hypothetical protein